MTEAVLVLTPLIGVGPFRFGEPAPAELLETASKCEGSGALDWECWDMGEELPECSICLESGVIVSVSCYGQCVVGGVELIGASEDGLASALGRTPTRREWQEIVDDRQEILYFDDLALMVWMAEDKCVTVQCSSPSAD